MCIHVSVLHNSTLVIIIFLSYFLSCLSVSIVSGKFPVFSNDGITKYGFVERTCTRLKCQNLTKLAQLSKYFNMSDCAYIQKSGKTIFHKKYKCLTIFVYFNQ